MAQRNNRRLCAIGDIELDKDVADIILDGSLREMQPIGNVSVREPIGNQLENFDLALAQIGSQGRVGGGC